MTLKLNVRLLRRVKKAILAEPRQFIMGWYFGSEGHLLQHDIDLPRKTIPNCKTAACMGGWIVSIAKKLSPRDANNVTRGYAIGPIAAGYLGISVPASQHLFHVTQWPQEFYVRWNRAKTHAARARIAAARIEAFITDYKAGVIR